MKNIFTQLEAIATPGTVKSLLDAGGGSCTLDALLRAKGVRVTALMSAHSPPGSTSDHPGRGVRVVTGDDWRLTTAPLRSKMQALMVVVPTSRESTWSDDMMMRDLSMECCFLAR